MTKNDKINETYTDGFFEFPLKYQVWHLRLNSLFNFDFLKYKSTIYSYVLLFDEERYQLSHK